jgi:hypothetical protein
VLASVVSEIAERHSLPQWGAVARFHGADGAEAENEKQIIISGVIAQRTP